MKLENVTQIKQKGLGEGAKEITQFVTTIPFRILAQHGDISTKSPSRPNGYQREVKVGRIKGRSKTAIPGYLLDQLGVFPTSFLINIRIDEAIINFEEKEVIFENIASLGSIDIPDGIKWWIIDGQHRFYGLKGAIEENDSFKDYPVIITMTNQDHLYEMIVFYLVNNRQKSVASDLAYHILRQQYYGQTPQWFENMMSSSDKRKAIASKIVITLHELDSSPFKERIHRYGEVAKPEHLATDGQLTKYVSYILNNEIFENMYDDDVAKLVSHYWKALENIYPECFENPRDYALFGTLGLSALSRLFPAIYGYCSIDGDTSKQNMEKYLRFLTVRTDDHPFPSYYQPITAEWWHKKDSNAKEVLEGTGEGHYKKVFERLAKKIALVKAEEEN